MSRDVTRRASPAPAKPDVVGLVMGSLISLFAAGTLFVAFGGSLSSAWLKAAVPVLLIAVGAAGLLMSRSRDTP